MLERALAIIEPPKALKEKMNWDAMSRNKRTFARSIMAGLEIVALHNLAAHTIPQYRDIFNATAGNLRQEMAADFQHISDESSQSRIKQDETRENSKPTISYRVSNQEELSRTIADINSQSTETKKRTKYEILVNGEIVINEKIILEAQGKQESESNKYFETNAGLILPEGVALKLTGNDPNRDKLIFSNQKIGIYGQNLGETTIANLTIERNGTNEQPIEKGELVRSLLYLNTKNESIVTSRASINNVILSNNISQVRNINYRELLTSGMTFAGFQSVDVQSATLKDFYWDGIAAFGGRYLTVRDSLIRRDSQKYVHSEGSAIVLIPGFYNTSLSVMNTRSENYLKYFSSLGPYQGQSSISLTDVSTLNELEPAFYLTTSVETIYLERVNTEGKGLNMIIRKGLFWVDDLDVIGSNFIIQRKPTPDNFYEPGNVIEIAKSPKANLQNSFFSLNYLNPAETELFNKHQIAYRIH